MKRFFKILLGKIIVTFSIVACAYEVDTHTKLSVEAYNTSSLVKNADVLDSLGLKDTDKFKNSKSDDHTIRELIGDGANFEDNLSLYRPINHFFDPLTGKGLSSSIFMMH